MRGVEVERKKVKIYVEEKKVEVDDGDMKLGIDIEGIVYQVDGEKEKMIGVKKKMMEGKEMIERVNVDERVKYIQIMEDIREGMEKRKVDVSMS